MKAYGVNELREMFLSFFESKDHLRLPSFSLVPQNDKSILLINAGMTPMKPWFKGEQVPPRKRVCTCQKCIRTGDIENVGHTARHGTYFEMLGNFSFGDYFKHEAIAWSWEFLTSEQWVGLDPNRLYPSVYVDDDEAWNIWHDEIGIPAEKIFRFGKEDNFWEHGSGPCGPCSEIYYDRGEKYGCGKPGCTVGCDCDRYIEIWNNVFSQFDNDGHDNYTELKQKNIDTGMGLERLAAVCQNVDSLFDVDTVMNITNKVSELTGAFYGQSQKRDVSLRVITDHVRAATFMICDGILPSNEGRGYVLRRLLRRAARHGKLLGVNRPFLYEVVDTVVHENEGHYPELRERQAYITKVIRVEEENFSKTIDGGMKIFDQLLAEHKAKGETTFSGADAFKLYDTYGFPIDLTIEMAQDAGMTVDQDAFAKLMQEQKERARQARKALGDLAWAGIDFGLDNTPTEFTGYTEKASEAKVLGICVGEEITGAIAGGETGILVLDQTPFYAEMGGQVSDAGLIEIGGESYHVMAVQQIGNARAHVVEARPGLEVRPGDRVHLSIDAERRRRIEAHHTATHLLHCALHQVVSPDAAQQGSFVSGDRLRFDFNSSAVSPDQLRLIEEKVNGWIEESLPVHCTERAYADVKGNAAIAQFFGDKYGDVVRVVQVGGCRDGLDGVSMEFCGGTHIANTKNIGLFKIKSEGAIASGVRRIEAVTGEAFLNLVDEMNMRLVKAAELLKTTPIELINKAQSSMNEIRELHQTIEKMKDKLFAGDVDSLLFSAKDVNGLKVVTASRENTDANDLRKLGDFLRDKNPNTVAALGSVNGEKVTLLAVCGKNAVARGIKAGDIIKNIAPIVGGKGGGKPDSAMGGGSDPLKVDDALASVDDFVSEKLG